MKCHFGIELPAPPKPCPKCGAKLGDMCGFVYYAGQNDERARCIALIREWIHGAPTTTTEHVLLSVINDIERGRTAVVPTVPSPTTERRPVSQVNTSNTDAYPNTTPTLPAPGEG